MHSTLATTLDRTLFVLGCALLLALSIPGIEVHADSAGIAPSSRELTGLGAEPPLGASSPAQGASCAASDPAIVAREMGQHREAMQRMAQAMADAEGGEAVVLDGRGYGYLPERNPAVELMRLQREAQLQAQQQAERAR